MDAEADNDKIQRLSLRIDPAMNLGHKVENLLTMKDLEKLQSSLMVEKDGYSSSLSLTREQFCDAMLVLLQKGSQEEYGELFDKIDVSREGCVDWDKMASHLLLEFYEREDDERSTQVPQWKDVKSLASPHKDVIQRIVFLNSSNRYIAISKEGCVSMWNRDMKCQRTLKTQTAACKSRDLWVTNFAPLPHVNKIAVAFTSKEIAIYDLSSKLEFNCQYKVLGLTHIPLCIDYWSNTDNVNEAIMVFGDVAGFINILFFLSASISLFERPLAPASDEKQEPCLNVPLADIVSRKYKSVVYTKYEAHRKSDKGDKGEWVREVKYCRHLECFISCATCSSSAIVIGWMERHSRLDQSVTRMKIGRTGIQRKFCFNVPQGVKAFSYSSRFNQIASAGVNSKVCLWNPYVVSKPNGVLQGHVSAVVQVQFITKNGQLVSFSKDKVLRIWDVQLQVCIQRLAGVFPHNPEVASTLFFHEATDRHGNDWSRLLVTFNQQITVLDMKVQVKGRVVSHEKPVIAALYNSLHKQVISVCQAGSMSVWMADTGKKVKEFSQLHGKSEVTCLSQDQTETRLFTGSTDGTVKVWDLSGNCYHTLHCCNGQPADVGQILVLKRTILVVGWARYLCVFHDDAMLQFHVQPAEWKGGKQHREDVLCLAFKPPNTLVSGDYDGEVIIWNTNSEHASRRLKAEGCAEMRYVECSGLPLVSRTNAELTSGGIQQGGYGKSNDDLHSAKANGALNRPACVDDQMEPNVAVSQLMFLNARKGQDSGAANLVSCFGCGRLRFWNTCHCAIVAEFLPHPQGAGGVSMATDDANRFLVTADGDGVVKVWDVEQYAVHCSNITCTSAPHMLSKFQPHRETINSLDVFGQVGRTLVLSASSDCSVVLSDISGNRIGSFGQVQQWRLDVSVESSADEEPHESESEHWQHDQLAEDGGSLWEPDEFSGEDLRCFSINAWRDTILGREYKERRVRKRKRRQPGTIPCLPYLETGGHPNPGPYSALDTKELVQFSSPSKPDTEKYFVESSASRRPSLKLPSLTNSLRTAFDEKTLFPDYILEFERNMKNYHEMISTAGQKQKNIRSNLQDIGMQMGRISKQSYEGRHSLQKDLKADGAPIRLEPLTEPQRNSITTLLE